MFRHGFVAICLIALPSIASAIEIPAPRSEELAAGLRSMLLADLPAPLTAKEHNWGNQVENVFGRGKKNHGVWRKIRVAAMDPASTLTLVIRDMQQPTPNITKFQLVTGLDVQVDFEQQIWEHGVRVYSGSTKARARVTATLQCEVESHAVPGKGFLPDLVFHLSVKSADLKYRGLDFVHIAGMGGDGAEILGHGLHGLLKLIKPSLEKDLLAKADAAIVKAGDKKEIRVGLSKFLSK
jgi:hypothetical protein